QEPRDPASRSGRNPGDPAGARRVDLPTYAFQHERFWPKPSRRTGDPAELGLVPAQHPLLGAAVALPETGGVMFPGRVSLATHPWLADHAVHGGALFPGTGFVELALRAADEVGCGQVEELTLEVPLIFGEHSALHLQVAVGGADDDGRR